MQKERIIDDSLILLFVKANMNFILPEIANIM